MSDNDRPNDVEFTDLEQKILSESPADTPILLDHQGVDPEDGTPSVASSSSEDDPSPR